MSIKRTIITAIVGLTLVALVAPVTASAVTIEELMAQIGQLQAQLLVLQQGQGGGTPVPTGSTLCAGITFSRALTVGSTGSDVKCLQVLLNNNGFTLAQTGAGSPGMETSYFGPITLAATRSFQASKGWTPANQVGPLTRVALNALITSGTPYVPPTAGCPAGAVYNSITGALCATTPIPSTGVEGSIAVTASVSPVSGVEALTGQANVAIAAVDVKATGSDVLVNRVDFNFTGISGTACNVRPWTNISGVTVSDGTTSKSIPVTSSTVTEVTVGTTYTVRVDGLNILVSKDTTKKITLSVDGASALPSGATNCVSTIQFGANAVRGTDGAGISQYGPTAALTARTFGVKTGDAGTLTVSVSTDNPIARNVVVQETSSTDNVTLLKFNVEAKSNDVILRTVIAELLASDTLNLVVPTVKLLDGSTEIASTSTPAATGATTTFESLNLRITKGTTKTFTIVGNIAQTTSHYAEGQTVDAKLYATDVDGEDASTYAAVSATGSDVTAGQARLYLKAPTFALVSSSISGVTPTSGSTTQAANAVIKFNVTAGGGDIYIKKLSSTVASSGIHASTTDSGATATVAYTFSTNATEGTNAWKVSSGETKYFEVTGVVTNGDYYNAAYFAGMGVANVKWGTADEDADATVTQTWGLTDIKTSDFYLNKE